MYKDEKIAIIILTCNGEKTIRYLLESIKKQTKKGKILVIDSDSDDLTWDILNKETMPMQIKRIRRNTFNHGGTRQMAAEMCKDAEYLVFLTQDAILESENTIEKIINCFRDQKIGCAYGRQLPHANARVLGAHARLFNYPEQSRIKSLKDIEELGIKTAFMSDTFAAYRRIALEEVGGFPPNVIVSEDIYVAAKMLLKNWSVYYCAEAKVYHSHDYTIKEEFKRYLYIGRFYGKEKWIKETFGKAEGEGKKFVLSAFKYVNKVRKILLIEMCVRTVIKYIAYKIGMNEEINK